MFCEQLETKTAQETIKTHESEVKIDKMDSKKEPIMSEKLQNPVLSDEAREIRNAYLREWRKKNRDKCAEYRRRYWEKKAGEDEQPE